MLVTCGDKNTVRNFWMIKVKSVLAHTIYDKFFSCSNVTIPQNCKYGYDHSFLNPYQFFCTKKLG